MKILAIDTATSVGGVALLDDDRVLHEIREKMNMTHAERIMVLVDQVFRETESSPDDLDGLAVSIGPGSFTGLRVGVNTAKGLSGGQELVVAPVSTLEMFAGNFTVPGTLCCPMLDARKGEVYTALFRTGKDGFPERLTEDEILDPKAAVKRISGELSGTPETPVVFCGDGAAKYGAIIQDLLPERAVNPVESESDPSPVVLARLGLRCLREGKGVDVHLLEPVYLRRTEAEVKREKRIRTKDSGVSVRAGKGS